MDTIIKVGDVLPATVCFSAKYDELHHVIVNKVDLHPSGKKGLMMRHDCKQTVFGINGHYFPYNKNVELIVRVVGIDGENIFVSEMFVDAEKKEKAKKKYELWKEYEQL